MKRYITTIIFTVVIVLLYHFIDIRLFSFDLSKQIRYSLFRFFKSEPLVDEYVTIVDIENLDLKQVKEKLEVLELLEPKAIGVNLCNMKERNEELDSYLKQNKNIITCDCDLKSDKRASWILNEDKDVTHFLSDKDTYFEQQLLGDTKELRERGNDREVINFRPMETYYKVSLSHVDSVVTDVIKDRIVVVGFLRDSLVTPLNEYYGYPVDEIYGDMSDAQLSANIISTIVNKDFIDEAKPVVRITIVLLIGLLNTLLLRLLRSRYHIVNIGLAVVLFIGMNMLSSMLIASLFFPHNYFLNLDEITAVLFLVSAAALYWNTRDNMKRVASAETI